MYLPIQILLVYVVVTLGLTIYISTDFDLALAVEMLLVRSKSGRQHHHRNNIFSSNLDSQLLTSLLSFTSTHLQGEKIIYRFFQFNLFQPLMKVGEGRRVWTPEHSAGDEIEKLSVHHHESSILPVILFTALVNGQSSDYCSFTSKHTMCQYQVRWSSLCRLSR